MNNNPSKIFQYIWAIISLLALGTAIYSTAQNGLKNSWILYLLFLIALMMYFVRRMQANNNSGIQ
jgi:hypothetical protein